MRIVPAWSRTLASLKRRVSCGAQRQEVVSAHRVASAQGWSSGDLQHSAFVKAGERVIVLVLVLLAAHLP